MTAQMRLPGFPVPVRAPKHRPRIADLLREVGALREALVRDRQERERDMTALRNQLDDLRRRLGDIERSAGLSDLARAPIGRDALRRHAGRLA